MRIGFLIDFALERAGLPARAAAGM